MSKGKKRVVCSSVGNLAQDYTKASFNFKIKDTIIEKSQVI
jgi:threonine dehydratase